MSTIKKSGIITICGRPNVGKSTLTNAFVGEKVAIVTNKPQTTRNRICGIRTRGESQFVFVDTPGLHKARTRLGDYMVDVVKQSVADVDAILLVVFRRAVYLLNFLYPFTFNNIRSVADVVAVCGCNAESLLV